MNEKIFPTVLMELDYLAAIPYAVKGDVKMAVYWVAAGVLTLAVTWL
jgi:hypothetical protein